MADIFIDLAMLIHEPEELYHAKSGEYETSHLLGDFIACPRLHFQKINGLIPDKDTPARLVGRATHKRILEGREAFEKAFAVGGPVNPQTGKPFGATSKAYQEWAAAQGKPVLTSDQAQEVDDLTKGVGANSEAVNLLMDGKAEGVVRAKYCDVLCQSRLDWVNPYRGIVDLKTTKNLTYFECGARELGYVRQMAFYRAMLRQVTGQLVPVFLIAVEKDEPHRCGVWRVSDDSLDIAQRENEAALRRLLRCRELGEWPTGYEEIRLLDAA